MNKSTRRRPADDDDDSDDGDESNRKRQASPSKFACLPHASSSIPSFVTEVSEHDVLLGRGAPVIQNQGNARFRALVQARKGEYSQAQRHNAKDAIARGIVHEVTVNRGGKFLRRVATLAERIKLGAPENAAVWAVVDGVTALEKTKQTLREKDYPRSADPNRQEETKMQSISAGESVVGAMLQQNLGFASGSGPGSFMSLHQSAVPSIPGMSSVNDQLALFLMQQQQQQQQQQSGQYLNDQLALQTMNLQQLLVQHAELQLPPSDDSQLAALLMLQRHRAARANRLQQQIAYLDAQQLSSQQQQHSEELLTSLQSSRPLQLLEQHQLAHNQDPYAATSALQLSLLQQQIEIENRARFSLQQGLSHVGNIFAGADSHSAAAAFRQHGQRAGSQSGGDGPVLLSSIQQQQYRRESQSPLSVSASTAAAAARTERRMQQQQDRSEGDDRTDYAKRKSADDDESVASNGSNSSSSSSVEYAKPASQKKPKSH